MTALPSDVADDLRLENTRLQAELRTARDRQEASAEILRAIAGTAGDAEQSLRQIAEITARLFGASSVTLNIAAGDEWAQMIRVGASSHRVGSEISAAQLRIGGRNLPGTVFRENRQIHIPDADHPDPSMADWPTLPAARAAGARAIAGTPLRREGKAIGALVVHRDRPEPFTADELALLQSFADQAVIAIENARLFNETQKALARQTATSDILRVISQSPTDVQPVFDAIVLTAARLFRCDRAFIQRCDAAGFWTVASAGLQGPLPITQFKKAPIDPDANFPSRAIVAKKTLHLPDWSSIELPEFERHIRELHGTNSALYMPLLRESECIGLLAIIGKQAGMFGESEIALAESFRDQALIAIENTRLFNETKEALERQTATAEILKVIAGSPDDVQPVFEAIVGSAAKLFEPCSATITTLKDDKLHWKATAASISGFDVDRTRAVYPIPFDRDRAPSARAIHERRIIEIPDVASPDTPEFTRNAAAAGGFRSITFVPLVDQEQGIGTIIFTHPQAGFRFSERQLALIQAFADQAVIAIQNARLFNETREALERQTATADILKVIASSPSDVQPVFSAIASSANALLGGLSTAVHILTEDTLHLMAFTPTNPAGDANLQAAYPRALSTLPWGGRLREGEIVLVGDTEIEWATLPGFRDVARMRGFRSILRVPMRRGGTTIGVINVTRTEPGQFADHHIQLLQTFADQAVIAIENTRLFNETREALERQTATADILKVIASSPSDVQPVFDVIVERAVRLCGARMGRVYRYDDGIIHMVAGHNLSTPGLSKVQEVFPRPAADDTTAGLAIRSRQPFFVTDIESDQSAPPLSRQMIEALGTRSQVTVPMLRKGEPIGAITVGWAEPAAYGDQQLLLLQTFADQAVIAIENVRLFNETREALERQTATADILKVIASSPSDVQPVFEAIAASANRLLGGFSTAVFRFFDGSRHLAAFTPTNPTADEVLKSTFPLPLNFDSAPFQKVLKGETVQIADTEMAEEVTAKIARARGFRSNMFCPLISSGMVIGMIAITRVETGSFAPHHVQLLQTFADQAVIAIENVRLFNETKEALERQTATADILKVIASSPSDVQPVFDAIATSANRLIGGFSSTVFRFIDGVAHLKAFTPTTPTADEVLEATFPRPVADFPPFKMAQAGEVTQIPDTEALSDELLDIARARGYRSMLFTPLMNDGVSIGFITVTRVQPGAFADHHVQLLRTFADQAVIAIENVRLFDEVQAKTRDLSEALQQQTATADVLKVISRSVFDLQTVLDTLVESAYKLCGASLGLLYLRGDEAFECKAIAGEGVAQATDLFKGRPIRAGRGTAAERVILTGEVQSVTDFFADPDFDPKVRETIRNAAGEDSSVGALRSTLAVPMTRDGVVTGVMVIARSQAGPFPPRQVELLQTFADQAVIAIENARLFDEVQAKTRDLTESLQQQTATANVLEVISRSAFDLNPVFETVAENSVNLCGSDRALIFRFDGELLRVSAAFNAPDHLRDWLERNPIRPGRHSVAARAALEHRTIHVRDVFADPEHTYGAKDVEPFRTVLGVPMLKGDDLLGVILVYHNEVRQFTDKQIALVETFADQAVIAIENVRLFDEVQARTRDLTEALTYQTGSSNILKVIASSPTDVGPVLEAIVESACELCEADDAVVVLREGDELRPAAHRGSIPIGLQRRTINPNFIGGRSVIDKMPVHLRDVLSTEGDEFPESQEISRPLGTRTLLCVPLLGEGESIGAILLRRTEVNPFSDKQIALLQTFADQAVIAIGNVRLFDEVQAKTRDLTEALTYQTGSSNILRVIASSPTDVGPVLEAIVESACELCEADDAIVQLRDGDDLVFAAHRGSIPVGLQRRAINPNFISGRAVIDKVPVHLRDVLSAEGDGFPESQEISRPLGTRTCLSVPLLREGESIGTILLRRTEVNPFSDKQIALLQTFADQAVIAIGNVRLFDEVQAKTRDLSEALTYQTGSSNILKVIASSPTDVGPVLRAIAESACELCDAVDALVLLKDGDSLRHGAHHGPIPYALEKWPINRNWASARAFLDRKPIHVLDMLSAEGDEFPDTRERARRTGTRTYLCVPLLREGESIGTIVLRRTEVHPFNEKQIALLQTFADQAVIAIGNVRLFDEVQARTRDLTESLQQQTATADVLKVISRSAFDLQAVFDTLLSSAVELSGGFGGTICVRDGDVFPYRATVGATPEFAQFLAEHPATASRQSTTGRVILTGEVVNIPDILADSDYRMPDPGNSTRSSLGVPLLRNDKVEGVLVLARKEVGPFEPRQVELVKTFADQAVIAIENVRLFDQVQARTKELAASLDDLRTAQDRLVQTEKLASLGQLTAGIAHEIKNPLNFVNNFAALSAELTDELNDVLAPAPLDDKTREEVGEITHTLKDNLQKVVQHGKRADSIVKNMLLHSREGSGEHRPADINALVDESLNLAYHGARAEKPQFNVTLQRDFDEKAGTIDVFPQEITRVFLNLISNGFYAVTKRKNENGGSSFEPIVRATTKSLGDTVEIRIRDNGTGIPDEVKEKMFNPFFTTKPAGEGTGLGLSMSHDIIVKQHGGTIDVLTEPGQFTEFTIVLPRTGNVSNKSRG